MPPPDYDDFNPPLDYYEPGPPRELYDPYFDAVRHIPFDGDHEDLELLQLAYERDLLSEADAWDRIYETGNEHPDSPRRPEQRHRRHNVSTPAEAVFALRCMSAEGRNVLDALDVLDGDRHLLGAYIVEESKRVYGEATTAASWVIVQGVARFGEERYGPRIRLFLGREVLAGKTG